ncbi:MAG: hypothetical protein ACPLXC_02800 [Candidatus Pacearchaeota archaeon]
MTAVERLGLENYKELWKGIAMEIQRLHNLVQRNHIEGEEVSALVRMVSITDAENGVMSPTKEFEKHYLQPGIMSATGWRNYIDDLKAAIIKIQKNYETVGGS